MKINLKKVVLFIVMCSYLFLNLNFVFAENTIAGQEMRTQVLYLASIIDDSDNMLDNITRGELARMFVKSSKFKDAVSDVNNQAVFSDVPIFHPYASYIKVATKNGYMTGFLNGSFKPDDFATYNELVRGTLALLGYENEDFVGNQINGRFEQFCALEIDKNIDKNLVDFVTKKDCVNGIYNMLKAKMKGTQTVYGTSVFDMTLNDDKELNASGLLKVKMEGPFIAKRHHTLYEYLPFDVETANYYLNGVASSYNLVQNEISNKGFIILYYNQISKTVYAYGEGNSLDSTTAVTTGYVTHIYYNASDVLTPNSVDIDRGRYKISNSEVKFALSYAGTIHIGDRVIFVYERTTAAEMNDESNENDTTYIGNIKSIFIYDLDY